MAYEYITKYTSPNSSTRAYYGHTGPPTGLTIHHWGEPSTNPSFDGVVSWLCNPVAGTSAHYVVEAGRVACIVDPDLAGWHSGNTKGNGSTVGLELNPHCRDGDYETAAELIRDLREAYGDLPLYPHKYWTATACPGNYDLDRLDRLARRVTAAAGTVTPITPAKTEGFLMALTDTQQQKLYHHVTRYLDMKTSEVPNKVWRYTNPDVEESDAYFILRAIRDQQVAADAQLRGLVGALAATAGGEPFDEAKLLEGIRAASAAGLRDAIESIETTVTVRGD